MNNAESIIDRIQAIRSRNNQNWMDLVRLAFRVSPDEAKVIFMNVLELDKEISQQVEVLLNENPDI